DVDAGCVVYGIESLAMRRGITHGPIALLVLPLLLAGALWWFDRWQARRGKRPEGRLAVDFKWLLALCYIGTLSHPLFDWFNNYGIRLLEPFSSQWFYGDTLFIIDLWILIALGIGLWRSLRRERAGQANWAAPAQIALAVMAGYVGINMAISCVAEETVRRLEPGAEMVVANAIPIAFWRRDVLWRSGDGYYGSIPCDLTACQRYPRTIRKTNWPDPRVAAWAKDDPAAQAFLFWSRMPLAQPGPKGILLKDQRFADSPARDNFTYLLNPR
ncbi:MAG: metal-dependent hydrolase, partial [Novosphingobium sp.]